MACFIKKSLEERKCESERILQKHSTRIPILVDKVPGSDIIDIDRKKYLVPKNLTVGQFLYVIRKRIQLSPEQALFIFVNNNVLVPLSQEIGSIYNKYKSEDGFLYINYSGENTFG